MATDSKHLRVLIANEHLPRLEQITSFVAPLGHDVVAREVAPVEIARLTREERPDVAIVGVGSSNDHALALISKIVHEACCPVIAVLHDPDPAFVAEAAKRGVFAYIAHDDAEELQNAIEIVLHRFAEFRNLEGAFGRRAVIERAKGILMERHAIDEREAFDLLRQHSRRTARKLADLAQAVADSHLMLPAVPLQPHPPDSSSG